MSRSTRIAALVGIVAWCGYLATASGQLGSGDAVAMYEQATSILDRGALDVSPAHTAATIGLDGRAYLPFGIGQALFDLPFVIFGRAARVVAPPPLDAGETLPKAIVALATTIPAALAVAFGVALAWQLSGDAGASIAAGFALAFATLLWHYATVGANAALAASMLTGGVCGFIAGATRARAVTLLAGGAAFGAAMLTRHEFALAAGVAVVWLAWQIRSAHGRARLLAAGVAGPAIAAAVSASINVAAFGNPFDPGYRPGFSGAGFLAYVAAPGGAVWLYTPLVVAVVALASPLRHGTPAASLVAGIIAVMWLFYGALDDWLGTRSYGPRYLVPLLPLMVAPLAIWWRAARDRQSRRARQGLLVLCAISALVQIPGVLVDPVRAAAIHGRPTAAQRGYDWQWSPLVLSSRTLISDVPGNAGRIAELTATTADGSSGEAIADRLGSRLKLWWLYLYHLGTVPGIVAALLAIAPIAAGLLLLPSIGRAAHPESPRASAGSHG